MAAEVLTALQPHPGGRYADGTLGGAGHAASILAASSPTGWLSGCDRDGVAIETATARLNEQFAGRFEIRRGNFAELADWIAEKSCDGVLLDLGVSSPQIDVSERGFSFRREGPLDMRMDPTRGDSVADWLATADVDQISEVIRDYGEERFAFPIAKAIVARRQASGPLSTTLELAQLVAGTVKTREAGQDPATRTFQALRIFINAELEELEQALDASLKLLVPGGRLVVISFHSLEDRIVKQFMAKHSKEVYDRRTPFAVPPAMKLRTLDRIKPSAAEVAANPRSRSAIMRVAERTEVPA